MKKVTIYTTPTCGYCHMAKEYFKEEGVEYEEKDVSVDAEARAEMVNKTNQMGVPVIEIGKDVIIGFNKPKLVELLGV